MSTVTVSRWGNSLAFRIPSAVVRSENIVAGDAFSLDSKQGILSLRKTRKVKRYQLEDVLSSFQTNREEPNVEWGDPQGREVW